MLKTAYQGDMEFEEWGPVPVPRGVAIRCELKSTRAVVAWEFQFCEEMQQCGRGVTVIELGFPDGYDQLTLLGLLYRARGPLSVTELRTALGSPSDGLVRSRLEELIRGNIVRGGRSPGTYELLPSIDVHALTRLVADVESVCAATPPLLSWESPSGFLNELARDHCIERTAIAKPNIPERVVAECAEQLVRNSAKMSAGWPISSVACGTGPPQQVQETERLLTEHFPLWSHACAHHGIQLALEKPPNGSPIIHRTKPVAETTAQAIMARTLHGQEIIASIAQTVRSQLKAMSAGEAGRL